MAFSSRLLALASYPINPKKDPNHGRNRTRVPDIAIGHHQSITKDLDMSNLSIKHTKKVSQVRDILQNLEGTSKRLVMIDELQRLCIDYLFQEEIESFLNCLYMNLCSGSDGGNGSMYDVALRFRLLREHGYHLSPDVFNNFKDKEGGIKLQSSSDIKGMMGLYEASKLAIKGEEILDEASEFASKNLIASMAFIEPGLARLVSHALENPFHMSIARFNIKNHLKNVQGIDSNTKTVRELAKLDFNIVQSMNQSELKEVKRWWRDLGLSQELRFARDQPVKWFMGPLVVLSNPQFSKYRIELTKSIAFIYIIDDIFDVYGTLDELILFTEAINKWDHSTSISFQST